MNTKDLMSKCQDYYGLQYTKGLGSVVIQYLDTISDLVKGYVFAETVKKHSVSFKSLPDVSTFEGVINIAWEGYRADNPKPLAITAPVPDNELATESEIAEFEEWMKSHTWKRSEFKKVRDWKREDRLA